MIPRCFKGETVVVVASGPSLSSADVEHCRGKARVAVINDNYKIAPWADLLYAADKPWWDFHQPEFAGQKWTQDEAAAALYGLKWVNGQWAPGISHSQNFIHYGYNSGFQCVNLVYLMGAKRILLLGFDMQRTAKKTHWFGDHPQELHRHADYGRWARTMDKAARRYEKAGIEVVNCSRETALREYKRGLITDCL